MTLEEFLDMWSDPDRKAIICDEKDYFNMAETIDNIKSDSTNEIMVLQYALFAIVPGLTQFKATHFLQEDIAESEVTHFFIAESCIIVWILPETDEI